MFKHNILPKYVKIISITIAIILIVYMCAGDILQIKSYATTQTTEKYSSSKISSYSGYQELIEALQTKYPNWTFKILYTGLDWNQVIKNETTASHGRNLVSSSKTGAWVCSTCGDTTYDSGNWKCASETAVSYYMDPRNWINEDYIFQFEELTFDSSTQTLAGVEEIISSAKWMQGSTITYTTTSGTTATINKSYAQIIMEAAEEYNVSAYHLASRIVQEQGTGSTASSTGKGTYSGYVGYYNFFNINATGSSIIANALTYAKNKGWTDPETAIKGGASYIVSGYISVGQSTLYLQKFDVDNSDGKLYYHQYMQNVSAAVSESTSVKSSYSELGMLNSSFTFIIPVYENMPDEVCASPDSSTIVTQNVQVTGTNVKVRSAASLTGSVITTVNTGDVLLRIECASSKVGGYYWDKVVLSTGEKGYIARTYITQISDVTNCSISAVANTTVNLRNGPGTSGTTVVTTLTKGQAVTIIEQDAYNDLNGYDWVRVKLSSGTQGYIASKYLTVQGETTDSDSDSSDTSSYISATVTLTSGTLKVRSSPSTSGSVLASLSNGATVTVTEESVATANGYTWDKIVTSDGIEGYVASKYLTKGTSSTTTSSDYMLGDCTGDNVINSGDLLALKKHLLGTAVVTDSTRLKAMDVNKDGSINSGDLLLIKKHLLGTYTITN